MAKQQLEKRLKLGWSWFSRPVPLLAASAAVALAGAFVAATDLPPVLRALAAFLGVAALTVAGCALRWREHRFLAKAAEIALRSARGERSSPAADCIPSPALASVARALNEAGDAIAAREAQFALLARATGDAVWDWDLDTDLVACSTGGKSVLGGEAEAFVQPFSWWQKRVHPDDRGPLEAIAADIRSGVEKLYSKEYRLLHADGNYRFVWDRGVIVEDGSGRAVRIVGCMTDISDRKAAEDMLRHVEMRQHALITAVSSIVWRDELGAELQPRNPAWEDYTGQSQEEEFGKGWLDAVHPEDREGMRRAWSTAMQNGTVYQVDIRLRRRDGSYRWMSARGAPVRDSAGKLVEYIGLYEDVDDYYAAREELRRKTHELGERVKEMRCLHAVNMACNKDEAEVAEILSGVALVLASAMMHPEAAACAVEWNGETFLSPFYHEPTTRITATLDEDGAAPGRISIGYPGPPGEYQFLPEEEQVLTTVASLVSQMLARRRYQERLEQQSQELWRRQAMFEQTERLAKVGGWEYDIETAKMTWSDEVRRIAGTGADRHAAADQDASAAAFLREPLETALRSREPFDLELPWLPPGGGRKWLHAVGQVQVVDSQPKRVFGIVKDITEEKEARSRMWHLANHDALTGLPNRRYFGEKLRARLAESAAADALLLIDLDHFKDVNDTLGHDVGDALLRAVAERLSAVAGESDMVARLGGDEFAVLARAPDPATARNRAASLLADLRRPMSVGGQMSSVRFSAGLAIAPWDGSSAAEILKNADIALYSGKMHGRNALVAYAPRMRESMERRVAVCAEVRSGLERSEFVPFYQPKVALRTGEIMGFEALIRWDHPSGMRAPGTFMPAFEDYEIALNLGKLMLSRIVTDMQIWRRSGLAFDHVALNTSAAEFTGFDLAGHVLGLLSDAGLPTGCLGIEVTETVLLGRDAESISPTLRRLHAAGVSIALDDFGTGYASLTHLQQYPVDVIKIDQSFIRSIGTDSGSQAITSAVLGLGRSLGMTVIAEGIETAEQAALLTAAGCDGGQGYHFARPMPASEVPIFLRSWRGLDAGPDRNVASAA